MTSRAFAAMLIVPVVLLAGCFETKFKLGTPADAKINAAYLGDWEFTNPDGGDEKATLVVRAIDERTYFAEWTDLDENNAGKGEPTRMAGFTADVSGVAFVHLRSLSADGKTQENYLVMRIELDDGQLLLRNLHADFFKDKPLNSDADFRKLIESNLENPDMYNPAVMVGKKRPK